MKSTRSRKRIPSMNYHGRVIKGLNKCIKVVCEFDDEGRYCFCKEVDLHEIAFSRIATGITSRTVNFSQSF